MADNKKISFFNILELGDEYTEQLREWRNQEHVRKMMFSQDIISKEQHEKFLTSLKNNPNKKVFVAFIGEKPFGSFWIEYFAQGHNVEFSYYLIEEEYLNTGLGIVLEYAILNYAFNEMKVHKVFCRTMTFNKKVVELHSKFGFTTEGNLKEQVKLEEDYADICCQGIFLSEWETSKTRIEKILNSLIGLKNIGEIVG